MTQSIIKSVGDGGGNRRTDVAMIQILLAEIPEAAGGTPGLGIDAVIGENTIKAIRRFQKAQFAIEDGLVQPDDYTMKRLNAIANRTDNAAAVLGGAIRRKHLAIVTNGALDLGDIQGPAEQCQDGVGTVQRWGIGSIYHHPMTGAFEVHGLIYARYLELGEERSTLGYPISDETMWIAGGGRSSHFQYGGLFWTSEQGVTLWELPDF